MRNGDISEERRTEPQIAFMKKKDPTVADVNWYIYH